MSYKLEAPKLKVLKLDAVEKFRKNFSEAFAHDSKLRAFPLIEQNVIDHVDIEQQVSPVDIKPATPGGSVGRTALVWPDDFEKQENNEHLFDFLTKHATPGDDSESESMLRQVKCPSRGLHTLQLTDVTTPLATFQRRAKTLKVADDTATSIFIHSFLSTQPQLAQQVEDSKPQTTRDAIKTLVERLKALDQARSLIHSLDLQLSAPRKPPREPTPDNKNNTDQPRQQCLGCGHPHHTKHCRKGPWLYTADYSIYHAKDSSIKPKTAIVPKHLRAGVDRHLKNLSLNKQNSAKKADMNKDKSNNYIGVPCYPAILSLTTSDEHQHVENLFWDTCLSHSLLESSVYDYFVTEYGAPELELNDEVSLSTWGAPIKINRSIELDVTLQPPHVAKELTTTVEFFRGPPNVGSGLSNTVLGSLGLHARLQQLSDQQQSTVTSTTSARRATIALPCAPPDDTNQNDDGFFTASLEVDINNDDELPHIHNDNATHDLHQVLNKHRKRFPKRLPAKPAKIPPFRIIMIDVNQRLPYRRPRRYSNERRKEIRKQVRKMLKEGIINISHSPIASTVVLARKPDQTWRFCVDYRVINDCTIPDAEPLPRMDDIIENLRGRKYFAIFDLRAGYHQIELDPASRKYSAFVTDDGLYEFIRLPFGFKNAPGYFMRQIRLLLSGHLHRICEAYLDDIVVWGDTIAELAHNIDLVLSRLADHNIVLKASKCTVGQSEIHYLGHRISADGIRPDPARIAAITNMPPPTSVTGIRSFLGVCQFVRPFVHDFARIAVPLTSLLKKNTPFVWGEDQAAAFSTLKTVLSDADTLAHFDPTLPTQLRCDASLLGVGGVLLQQHGDDLLPVAYTSKTFNTQQRNWTTIEQECFGIVHCVDVWRHYLAGHPFQILTDHRNLTFLTSCTTPKVQRWATMLLDYHFSVRHLPGHLNQTADHLSRHPIQAAYHARMAFHRHTSTDDTTPSSPSSSTDDSSYDVSDIIAQAHNAIIGHGGIHRTLRVLDRWDINWPTRRADVVAFVKSCHTCQAADGRAPSVPLAPDGTIIRHEPFSRYAIDLAGPYPVSANNYRYILIVVDSATRFVELTPLPDKTATAVADGLISLFGRYGCPLEIHSDRGTEFVNNTIDALLAALNISRSTSIPYRPASNGQAERHVKEVTRHLRDVVFEDKTFRSRWCRALPIVQRILNATVLNPDADTKDHVTPLQLLFADRITPDRSLIKPSVTTPTPLPLEATDYIAQLRDVQSHILTLLPSPTAVSPALPPIFTVGTHVLLSPASRPADKLAPKLSGPYIVASVRRNLVTITDLQTGRQRDVHASRLRTWTQRSGVDPANAAADASTDYVVEAVVGHKRRPNTRGRPTKEKFLYLVRWEDFPNLEDHTYQSYASVKHTHALTSYLNSVSLT